MSLRDFAKNNKTTAEKTAIDLPKEMQGAVGKPRKHDSADLHVSGEAVYIDDMREPEGTLHVIPGFAPVAKGKITKLDLSAVKAAPGVIIVLTVDDIPGINDCSPAMGDDPILIDDQIEFYGQVAFAVVATDRLLGRKATRLAVIETEEEAPILTARDGHAKSSHILPPYEFKRGDASSAIDVAQHQLEDSFKIGGQEHFYLEGQVAFALPGEAGEMLVYSSSQHPSEVQHTVAKMLGLPDAKIVCTCRRMGGGFGGKESQAAQWAALAALAAYKTGHPAKMRLDRDDDMIMTGKRHDIDCSWRAGFDSDGRLQGVSTEFLSRCGYSADLSLGVNDRSMFHADNAYYYPDVLIHSERIKTNTVSNTAFRGFGGPQGMLFAERMMDAIAIQLGIDPLDVRYTNLYGPGRDTTPYGMQVTDNILPELMADLEKSTDYRARRDEIDAFNKTSKYLKKGLALNPVKFGISFTLKHLNQAGALVHVYSDGSVQINHGGTEMGQGLYIKVAQIVAEEFGIDTDHVKITATTTDKVPNASPTAASSGSDLNGMAAQRAARTIRDRMTELAARLYQCSEADITFADNHVHMDGQSISFAELAKKAVLERVSLSATGFYATPGISWDREQVKGRPFLYFAYGAACAEVTIDTLTGENTVDRVDILHDVGRSLNPAIDIGQIEGGFVQGQGWLTTEELVFDGKGRLTTHAPSTYKIPTAFDMPTVFNVELWQSKHQSSPAIHRSKAVGEPPLMLATAVYSAILNAISSINPGTVPPLDAPATPENILKAVEFVQAAKD